MLTNPTISFAEAKLIAERCIAVGQANGAAIAVAIVDQAARPILLYCLDGAIPVAAEAALVKARTAVFMRESTAHIEQRRRERPIDTSVFKVFEVEGGEPFFVGENTSITGQCCGGIGVAGAFNISEVISAGMAAWGELHAA